MKKSLLFGILSFLVAISMMGQQQMPNGGMEEWENPGLGYEDPVDWQTPNESTLITTIFTTTKSTDAAVGTYSAKLESKLLAGQFVSPGVITLGNFIVDYINNTAYLTGGIPFTDRPLALRGSYKNYPAANDSTLIVVIFTEYVAGKGKTDTIGMGIMYGTETVDTWTIFNVPITFFNDHDPDTMNMHVVSSNMISPNAGSYMYIDNLSFEYEAGIEDVENTVETSIFPNPVTDRLSFSFEKEIQADLKIFSNDGQLVYTGKVNGNGYQADLGGLATGTYYYSLFDKSKKISSGQFVISR
jgi:hypothetical protein